MHKVYAIALYVSRSPVLDRFGAALGEPFHRALIDGTFGRTLVYTFHRAVSGATVVGALRDALTGRAGAGPVAAFESALLDVLGGADLGKGERLYLACGGAALHGAKGAGAMEQPPWAPMATSHAAELCPALLDVYLGAKPIAPAAKQAAEILP